MIVMGVCFKGIVVEVMRDVDGFRGGFCYNCFILGGGVFDLR